MLAVVTRRWQDWAQRAAAEGLKADIDQHEGAAGGEIVADDVRGVGEQRNLDEKDGGGSAVEIGPVDAANLGESMGWRSCRRGRR